MTPAGWSSSNGWGCGSPTRPRPSSGSQGRTASPHSTTVLGRRAGGGGGRRAQLGLWKAGGRRWWATPWRMAGLWQLLLRPRSRAAQRRRAPGRLRGSAEEATRSPCSRTNGESVSPVMTPRYGGTRSGLSRTGLPAPRHHLDRARSPRAPRNVVGPRPRIVHGLQMISVAEGGRACACSTFYQSSQAAATAMGECGCSARRQS